MPDNSRLVREKLDQAAAILDELGIDAWLTFVRETALSPDPSLDLILGLDMVWQSAFIVTRDNQRIAIVGKHDMENVEAVGGYTTIIPYVEGIRESLLSVLLQIDPQTLALNYSESDVAADGLAHGLMLLLQRYLIDTDLAERFVSAEPVIAALRGRKSHLEVERIQAAIETTLAIFYQVGEFARPGMSEVEVASFVHDLCQEQRLDTAWEADYCPTVSAGPSSPIGHAGPMVQYVIKPGALVHMDFGVRQDDYCADLQRVWYVRRDEDDAPPHAVRQGFEVVRGALQAGLEALVPGAQGWQVDAAARTAIVEAGYPEYQHAFGHHVGRAAHDGSTVLGPRWERYGDTPMGVIEAGNVFAIELGVEVEGYGYVGQEENVLVTPEGGRWLSDPQTEVWVI
ncbi:MAG: M24 family metallopeptidase [Chloroflexota bacterium]|jgi:Xaa-Pro aminopeptidase